MDLREIMKAVTGAKTAPAIVVFTENAGEVTSDKQSQDQELRLMPAREVKAMLSISDATLYRWRKKGILPSVTINGQSRYRESDVLAIAEGR